MLPPVATASQSNRVLQTAAPDARAQSPANPPQPVAGTATQTANAVEAARRAAEAQRLRDGETRETTERPPSDSDPTGPPPTFDETPLQRQARTAFDLPEAVPATVPGNEPDPEDAGKTSQPETDGLPGDERARIAATGFAEVSERFVSQGPSSIDKTV